MFSLVIFITPPNITDFSFIEQKYVYCSPKRFKFIVVTILNLRSKPDLLF